LKAITIIGTLITVLVIGFAAAMYLRAATAPVTNAPSMSVPYEDGGGSVNRQNAVGAARSVASMDKDRQRDIRDIMDKIDGAGTDQ
jgi:hypothetical protein